MYVAKVHVAILRVYRVMMIIYLYEMLSAQCITLIQYSQHQCYENAIHCPILVNTQMNVQIQRICPLPSVTITDHQPFLAVGN